MGATRLLRKASCVDGESQPQCGFSVRVQFAEIIVCWPS